MTMPTAASPQPRAQTNIRVSVIVPVRDGRGKELRRLLGALSAQTLPRQEFELLIGDDGSTDGSTTRLQTEDGWVRVFPGPPRNSYAARNRAAQHARGPVLAFCDSDCIPEPDWLESGLNALNRVDLAAGLIRFVVPENRTIWTLLDIETTKDHELQVTMANAETANLFVGRAMFDRVGGFDDKIPEHGDFDFAERCVAAGARLAFTPEVVVWHPTRNQARSFLRNLWVMHRWYAARRIRDGRRPDRLKVHTWIPLISPLRARRRFGRSIRLDRRRLESHGVTPSLYEDIQFLPLAYVFLPYFQGVAQLVGWWQGRSKHKRPVPQAAQHAENGTRADRGSLADVLDRD